MHPVAVGAAGVDGGALMGVRTQIVAGALGVSTGAAIAPGNVTGIPDRALVAYVEAAAEAPCSIAWYDLAAIGAVESGHGTHAGAHLDDDGRMTTMAVSWAGARGPMQFIDSTWDAYGVGDVNDVDDAARASARLLCADGFDRDPLAAVSAYNCGCAGPVESLPLETQRYRESWQEFRDTYSRSDVTVETAKGKERTIARLGSSVWAGLVRGWLRTGQAVDTVGLGGAWRAADDAAFGADQLPAPRANTSRSDKLSPEFGAALDAMLAASPNALVVTSGWRDPAAQARLWQMAQDGTGNPAAWSDGVTCESRHCDGDAADLAGDLGWAHANAHRWGIVFPYGHEPWHAELAS